MYLRCSWALAGVSTAVLLAAACGSSALADEEARREATASVLEFAEDSHYLNVRADDRVSQTTLENYMAALDELRFLFTQEDEANLRAQYGNQLDDAMRQGRIEPVFEIHRLYLQRQAQFRDFAKSYLAARPSLNTSREWRRNRWTAPRPRNQGEQMQLWKDRVLHEWINLVLEGWSYESARARLLHRFLFGDPLGVGREGFSFFVGELPGGRQPGSGAYDPRSAFALFLGAFARALDSDSSYASPESVWDLAERMEDLGWVRLPLATEGEYVVVEEQPEEPVPATPGELQAGDRIVAMDPFGGGEFINVAGWRPFEIHNLVFGPAGTAVAFRVLPPGVQSGAVERTAKRASLVTKQMRRMLRWTPKWLIDRGMNEMLQSQREAAKSVLEAGNGDRTLRVGAVRIPAIHDKCARDVRRLVRELKDEGIRALVVDLRNNSFGEIDDAVSLAGLFVGKGPVAQQRGRAGEVEVLRNTRQEAVWDGPLAVLVNQGSSSAAEVFAAAIQDYDRGVVLGERTLARGTGQVEFKVRALKRGKSDDPVMSITNREYFRVSGERIDQTGVQPDILLTMADEHSALTRTWALDADLSGPVQDSIEPQRPDAIPSADFRRQEIPRELLDALAARHRQRASQDIDHGLIADYLELSHERLQRQSDPINLDARRANEAAQWAEELALARAWIEAKGPAAAVTDPALAEFFLQAREAHVPESAAPDVEEPELVRAIMLAKGYVAAEGEGGSGYQQSSYDLPLNQAAGIVADWVRLNDGAASTARPMQGRQ